MTINYTISVNILPEKQIKSFAYTISTIITPAAPLEQQAELNYPFTFNIRPIDLNISEITKQVATEFFQNLLTSYIDEDRELKELLNYGEDRQSVILAKRFGPIDATGTPTIQLKLLQPVPDDIGIDDRTFISREVVNSVIDKFRVRFAPEIDATPFLRPKNTGIRVNNQIGKTLRNVTLQFLSLETGSFGARDASSNISFEDQIFRRWYSYDFNSSELNLDFTNYENFIFYGSAALRLESFVQKLYKLDKLEQSSKQFEGSVFTGQLASAGASYILEQSAKYAKEKEEVIRSFDRYEQYLYFTPSGSTSAYSASFDYVDGGTEYNSIGYWPKRPNNTLYHPTESIAANWYADQLDIARRYDEFNQNSLINTIPSYLRDDDDNAAYFTFVLMVGHFFDLIKPYIDQFPEIYSRGLNPNENLSKDLVYNIAEAVGFPLPTLNSLYDISDTILGTENTPPRRDYAVEAHKRILHNLPMFIKNKGTKTAIRAALRTLGIAPQLLDVWETGTTRTTVADRNTSRGTYVFEEYTNGLDFSLTTNGNITVPLSTLSRIPYPRSIEMSVKFASPVSCTILEGDDKWALNVVIHPTNTDLGRFEIVNNVGDILLSSSYAEIFDNNTLHLSLKNNLATQISTLVLYEVDTYGISFESTYTETVSALTPLWLTTNQIVIGGTESLSIGRFSGILDEFRLIGTNLSDATTRLLAQDPSSIAGDNYTQAAENLYVQLSFNRIDSALLPTSIINESPYKNKTVSPSIETLTAQNITSAAFTRYSRSIRQSLPVVGNSSYVSQKVYIAPQQEFTPEFVSGEGVKQLSRTRSVVTNRKLISRGGRNKVIVSTSPSRIINDNIIRTMGAANINSALGIPSQYRTLDNTLEKLRNYYNQYYYVSVNYNQYIRVLSEIHSVLNDYIEYFIPSKASLLRGIVIEPNILEQTKFPTLKNIRFYGSKSRKTQRAVASLTGSNADYEATFNVTQTLDIRPEIELPATYDTTDALIARELSDPQVISQTYDLQHLDWYEYQLISSSYSGSSSTVLVEETILEPYLGNFSGSFGATFPYIYALELAPDGKLYVGGHFTSYTGVTANGLIRLNRDGTRDTTFDIGTGFNNEVNTIKLDSNGKIYVGGNFSTYNGETNNRIIRLNSDGTKDTDFDNTTGFNAHVRAILLDGDKIYVAGSFTSYKSVSASRVVCLNPNGTRNTDFSVGTGFNNITYALELDADGNLYVAGIFTAYKSITHNRIIRLLPTGDVDATFDNSIGFNDQVRSLKLDNNGKLYVGGLFTQYKGNTETRIIRLNDDGTKDTDFDNSTGFNNLIHQFQIDNNNKVYVAGQYTTYKGNTENRIIRLNPDGTKDTEFDNSTGFNNTVWAIQLDDVDKLYTGGQYSTYNDVTVSLFAALDIDGALATEYITTGVSIQEVISSPTFLPKPKVSIQAAPVELDVMSATYDLQHLDWYEHMMISNSYVTSSDVFQETPFLTKPKVSIQVENYDEVLSAFLPQYSASTIDLGYSQLNKFTYNDQNRGTWGAEPFHRVYPRRLFDEELNLQRLGGITSLAPAGLYDIPPISDFNELAAYTYFNRPSGIYDFPITKYTPVYPQPLNATWDFDNQAFMGATTWSYAAKFNLNDVVYQNVTKDDLVLGELTGSARVGNGKYYVFTTKPAYGDPGDGTAWYSGSVPSYIPPSLDGTNWRRLRFRPQIVPDPRRIVFDTFTVPDPVLNNFRTTTLNINTPVDITKRYIDLLRISNIAPNSFVQGEILIQNIAALFALQSNNSGIRIRLYRTVDDMTADIDRDVLTLPTGSHGVLADVQLTEENMVQLINPIITLVADSIPPGGKLFYTINNLTSSAKISTTILGYYFAIQIEPRVPFGYLRKHYRFVRDNGTATKRRKYLGCKFKIVRYTTDGQPVYDTIDGRPPVEVFLSEGTDIIVNNAQSNNEIITGGGGTLRVT
jgi:uncharacterized delta-60 repeat protein